MSRLRVLLASVLLSAAFRGTAFSMSQDAGTRVANILTAEAGARPMSMGGAFTALADDANAQLYNPAGLGTLKRIELMAMHRSSFAGIRHEYGNLVIPFGQSSAGNLSGLGTIAAGFGFLDYGSLEGRDAAGNPTVDLGSYDGLMDFSYGKTAFGRFSFGFSAKIYRLGIYEREVRDMAYDFGLLYEALPGRVRVGLAGLNFGNSIRYGGVEEKAPQSWSGGIAVTPFKDRLNADLDVERTPDDQVLYKLGFEVWANSLFALRGGYHSGGYDAATGVTAGLGIRIREFEAGFFPVHSISLDYAFTPSDDLESTHTISLSFTFGD